MAITTLTGFVLRLAARDEPDGELVRRFADGRCEAAFAELVRRYGPTVFGVCRRALGDHHLAEDAFQAVFVVLARKADTIRPPGAVGGWLYGVARKAAAEATAMRRRKAREVLPGSLPDRPAAPAEPDDTAAVVDAEIGNLPAIYRAAVLLCEIEGVSRADAAVRLGIAQGTLSSRLAAARKLLGERLRRRGVGAVALGVGATAVPEALARAAVGRANGAASATVQELCQGVLRTMLISKLKLMPVAVVCAALAGVLFLTSSEPRLAADTPPEPRRVPVPAPPAKKPTEWKVLFTLEHSQPVQAVAACADLIAAAADTGKAGRCVWFWNATTGKASDLEITALTYGQPVRFNFLRFTTNDIYLIVGADSAGARYRRRPGGLAADVLTAYDLLACSADLNTLLVRHDPKVFIESRPNRVYLHVNPWVVDANFFKHLAVFEEDCKVITSADVSPDDRRVAIAGDDAVIRVYNRNNLRLLHKIALPKQTKIAAVRLADGGRLAVVGEGGFAKLFDADGKEACDIKRHEGTVTAVAFAPDGKHVVTAAGKEARMFDAASGELVATLTAHKDIVTAVAFSSDGKWVVTGSADKTAKVWERKE